jgi:hypothetical protein
MDDGDGPRHDRGAGFRVADRLEERLVPDQHRIVARLLSGDGGAERTRGGKRHDRENERRK